MFTEAGEYDAKPSDSNGYTLSEENKINGVTGPFVFPIYVDNLTIKKADGVGDVTITSSAVIDAQSGGNWNWQNFITVSGNNVTIDGVDLKANQNKYYYDTANCNKAIELVDGAETFTIKNSTIKALDSDTGKFSGSIYNSVAAPESITIENVTLSAWISDHSTTNEGNISIKGVSIDYQSNAAAHQEGYGPGLVGNDAAYVIDGLTIYADEASCEQYGLDQVLGSDMKSGTTYVLAAGTYNVDSPLNIDKSVTIVGAGADKTILQSDVTREPEKLITVAGGAVDFSLSGVYVKGLETNTHNNASALTIGSDTTPSTGTISITNCKFTDFTKNSITVKGGTATISGNEIECKSYPGAAGNGIQIDQGAEAVISNNKVSGYVAQTDAWGATGIMALRNGKITELSGNTLENCQTALSVTTLYTAGDTASLPSDLSGNTIANCDYPFNYELDGDGDLAAILASAQPGTSISLYGEYTLDSAATVKDGVSLYLADGGSYGKGNLTFTDDSSLTVAKGGTLWVDKGTSLTGDVTNNGTVENYGTITGTVSGDGSVLEGNMVTTEEELRAAIADYTENSKPIVLGNDITINTALEITVDNLVIDGNGHTLTANKCVGLYIKEDLTALTVKNLTLKGVLGENETAGEGGTGSFMGIGTYNLCYGVGLLTLTDVTIDGFSYGLYFGKNPAGSTGTYNENPVKVDADHLTIQNCYIKGAYFEKLTDSNFTGCQFLNNGTNPNKVASTFRTWLSGVDINLKNGSYQNIVFEGCTFTGNGANSGTALLIKARDDGNYGAETKLDGVTVTGCTFTDNNGETPIIIGEAGKGNKTPVNVSIQEGVDYTNNLASDAYFTATFQSDENTTINTLLAKGKITLPAAPAKEGYTFQGWSDGTNTYEAGAEYTVSANVTFTAQWSVISSGGGSGVSSYSVTVEKSENGTVTADKKLAAEGAEITLTVQADEGYVLDTLTVTDRDGNEVKLTDKGDGKYTFTMPASKVTVKAVFAEEAAASELPFTDVKDGDWFYEAVKYVYDNELMNGTSATTFSPYVTTSRAMIMTILARYSGVDTTTGDTWYEAGAAWAVANGVSDGTNLEADVTREQLVTMLWRLTGSPAVEGGLEAFPDAASVSDWAADAMAWAVETGIITGTGAGELNPQGTASRVEVAAIMARFVAATN